MSLLKEWPSRRQFLQRSALGAGSALFLPGLLASCSDHLIPDPSTPVQVGADAIDWNDDAKTVVVAGLGLIPEVGGILAALVDIFWPNTEPNKQVDVWSRVKDRVESLVNQKIADSVYQQVKEDLQGLNNSTLLYLSEVKDGNSASILSQWIVSRNSFAQALPHFQSEGYQVPLLGMFVQFANMYLALLRDGVVNGRNWGRSEGDQQQDVINLQTAIIDFINYTLTTYTTHLKTLEQNTPRNDQYNQPFATVNRYTREMIFVALDYMNTWPYYDVTNYPNGAKVLLPREVYSDPLGQCTLSGPINLVLPQPTKGPNQLTVWAAYDGIHSVQLTYPSGSGPGGVTTTPQMGVNGGDSATFTISPNNPIISATTIYNNSVYAIMVKFLDGTQTPLMGRNADPNYAYNSGWVSINDHLISRIHINGMSGERIADCVVYGFQFLNGGPTVSTRTLHALYITSPQEPSVADFAQAFPTYGVTANLITDELKVARLAYWASIKARAEALK